MNRVGVSSLAIIEAWLDRKLDKRAAGVIDRLVLAGGPRPFPEMMEWLRKHIQGRVDPQLFSSNRAE